jgi:hypothetical protein
MSAVPSAHLYPASRGFEPAGKAAPEPARSPRAAAPLVRTGPSVMRLLAVPRAGAMLDFRWDYISVAANALLPCRAWQLLGRCMSEGRAGAFDHPVLVERYRRVLEQGAARSFEQVHSVQGQQHLVVHHVACVGDGVKVTLIDLSAGRRSRSSWRSGHARAFMSLCEPT